MPTKEEIVLALGTHIWWKHEFEKAISDGWYFFNPNLAERGYQSEFALWLAELCPVEQDSQQFAKVQSLHAAFREQAENVARVATSGDIAMAEASIRTGLYAEAATALTLALRDWMEAVKAEENHQRLHRVQTKPPNPNRKQLGG
jgi:hypothetical protein